MSEHYRIICRKCGKVIAQCRCMDLNKEVRYSICEVCNAIDQPNTKEE